ncbi:hypothetical protein ACOMHN_044558 [Nucella lapillus]
MELGILHNSPPSTKRGCRAGRLHRLWHGLPPAPWPCTRSQHHSVPSRNLHPLMVPPFLQPHPDLQSAVGNAPLSSKHPAQLPTTDCLLSIISPMGGQPSDAPALSPPSPLQQGGQSSNAPALSPPSPLPQGGQPIALALSPPSPPPQGGQPSDAPGLSPSSSTLLLCPSDSTLNICHLNSQSAVKTACDLRRPMASDQTALIEPCHMLLRPLFLSLKILGLMFNRGSRITPAETTGHPPRGTGGPTDSPPTTTGRTIHLANTIFCLSVCVIMWGRTVSCVPSFWVGVDFYPDLFFLRACVLTWSLQCSLYASITLYESREGEAFSSFYETSNSIPPPRTSSLHAASASSDPPRGGVRPGAGLKKAFLVPETQPDDQPSPDQEEKEEGPNHEDGKDKDTGDKRDNNDEVHDDKSEKTFRKDQQIIPEEGLTTKDKEIQSQSTHTQSTLQTERQPKHSWNKYQKIGIAYTAIGWALVILSDMVAGLFFFGDFSQFHDIEVAGTNPFGRSLLVKVVAMGIQVLLTFAWILPPALCCGLCAVLRARFDLLTTTITTKLSLTENRFPPTLERWRQEHLRLCQCVVTLNGFVGKLLMATYVTNLPLAVLLLYQMTVGVKGGEEGGTLLFLRAYWFVMALAGITLLSACAFCVHNAVSLVLCPQ